MEGNEDELYNLSFENELKKMKISLEHGANFFSDEENDLPPEIESQWLKNIQQYNDAFANRKMILVHDFIGNPVCRLVNEIPEAEIKFELDNLLDLLGEKAIGIDTICEVDDRELYRFITEELFMEEMDDIKIEGMTHHFIYEEFHPNHEHDIQNQCKEFLDNLLNKSNDLNPVYMPITNEMDSIAGIITKEDAVKKMEAFREAYSSFELNHFNITSLEITEDSADVCFDVNYSACIEDSHEKQVFSGTGNFTLKCKYDYWSINKISIPQFSL